MKKLFKTLTCALAALLAAVTFAGCQGDPGVNGKTPEFRVENGVFQWKYTTDTEWQDIVDIDDLKGAKGDKGDTGATGATGPQGEKGEDGVTPQVAIYENLFNKEEAIVGSMLNVDDGEIKETGNDKDAVSPKIPYEAGYSYYWKTFNAVSHHGGSAAKVACYDADDKYIGRTSLITYGADGATVGYTSENAGLIKAAKFTMPSEIGLVNKAGERVTATPAYFRFIFQGRDIDQFMLVKGDASNYSPEYVAFGKTLIMIGDQTLELVK